MLSGEIIPDYSEDYTCMFKEKIAGFADNYKCTLWEKVQSFCF
jgi:hypothetical protein